MLDVHHERLTTGQRLIVSPYVDGRQVTGMDVLGDESEEQPMVSSFPLYGADGRPVTGSHMYCYIKLIGTGTSTPVFHGASLRFASVDNSYYQMRFDLRAIRRDKTNLEVPMEECLAFLKEIADSKRVVTMTTRLEGCQVRVSLMKFSANFPVEGEEWEPQGFVTVRLKRVST
jgi:hypothetical protein